MVGNGFSGIEADGNLHLFSGTQSFRMETDLKVGCVGEQALHTSKRWKEDG